MGATSCRKTAIAEITTVARMAQDGRPRAVLETVLVYRYGNVRNAAGGLAEETDRALSPVLVVLREDDPAGMTEAWEVVFDFVARATQAWPAAISWLLDLRALKGWLRGAAEVLLRVIGYELKVPVYVVEGEALTMQVAVMEGEQLEMWEKLPGS